MKKSPLNLSDGTERNYQESSSSSLGIALTKTIADQLLVARICPLGFHHGIREGMALPLAKALFSNLFSEQFNPSRDFDALKKLAEWCLRFTPLVGLDPELLRAKESDELLKVSSMWFGLNLDLTGTEKLHGNLLTFAQYFTSLFQSDIRVALAPTIGSAWALSRFGISNEIVHIPSQKEIPLYLSLLPIEALRIPLAVSQQLREVGIVCIHQLLSLPTRSLSQRFGKFLLFKLEQSLGTIDERVLTVTPQKEFYVTKSFETPLINRKSIVLTVHHLFLKIMRLLQSHSKCAGAFLLILTDCDGTLFKKTFSLATVVANKEMLSVIEPLIDGIHFFGELRRIDLIATEVNDSGVYQNTLKPNDTATDLVKEREKLLNNFSLRLGKERVLFAKIHNSHIPERSYSYESLLHQSSNKTSTERRAGAQINESTPSYTLHERPTRIYSTPERISTIAMLPDKPPSSIVWRGKNYRIISGFGPERIAPEWWTERLSISSVSERDYFKIQDEFGRWLWVYREQRTMEWFLHGAWI